VIVTEGCNIDGCARIWVGTGEASLRRDTYFGAGLLLLTPFEFGAYTVTPIGEELFASGSINNIVLGARGSDGLATELMVTVSRGVSANATHSTVNSPEPVGLFGIHRYTFGGAPTTGTWARVSVPGTETPLPFEALPVRRLPTDLESLAPDNLDHLLAGFLGTGILEFDVATGLWCPLNPGVAADPSCPPADPALPTPESDPTVFPGFDHIELAVVPSDPRIVYALFGQSSNRFAEPGSSTLFRRETDGSWRQVRVFTGGSLSRYTNALTVDPRDPNICYVGLQQAFRVDASAPTSTSTRVLTNIHSDHQAFTFAERVPGDPGAGYLFYSASDGGFAVSEVGGVPDPTELAVGAPRNAGLQIVQMHTIAGHRDTPILIGGTQDNDCIRFDLGGSWPSMLGITADCGFTAIDIDDSRIAFTAFQRFRPFRWPDLDTMGGRIHIDSGIDASLRNERVAFYAPIVQDPTEGTPEPNAIYFGSVVLDRSLDRGDTWTTVSPEIDPSGMIFPDTGRRDVIETLEGWAMGDIWDIPIYGYGFPPNDVCQVDLLASRADQRQRRMRRRGAHRFLRGENGARRGGGPAERATGVLHRTERERREDHHGRTCRTGRERRPQLHRRRHLGREASHRHHPDDDHRDG